MHATYSFYIHRLFNIYDNYRHNICDNAYNVRDNYNNNYTVTNYIVTNNISTTNNYSTNIFSSYNKYRSRNIKRDNRTKRR